VLPGIGRSGRFKNAPSVKIFTTRRIFKMPDTGRLMDIAQLASISSSRGYLSVNLPLAQSTSETLG